MSSPEPVARGRSIGIALVEDHQGQAQALTALLEREPDLVVVAVCSTSREALARLPALGPDVVLVDVGLPDEPGIETVRRLRDGLPHAKFLMLTVMERPEPIFAALAAGASGYLLKKSARDKLASAVRQVHAGEVPLSVPVARLVLEHFQQSPPVAVHAALTPREREVLDGLAEGLTYRETGERLGIALGTVQTHVERIYEKLQVRSRTQALRKTGHVGFPRSERSR